MLLWLEHPGPIYAFRDDAIICAHEAVEHAVFAGDGLTTLHLVRCITTDPRSRHPQLEIDENALGNALKELRQKSLAEIEKVTAITWAYHAWAAYQLGRAVDGVDLESEALEHAATSGDDATIETVRAIVKSSFTET